MLFEGWVWKSKGFQASEVCSFSAKTYTNKSTSIRGPPHVLRFLHDGISEGLGT